MLHLQHKVKVSFDTSDSVYLMDGILCNGEKSLALTSSSNLIKIFDVNNAGFQQDIKGHTQPITDIVASQSSPNILYSIQNDTGVMITDLRVGKAIHFLTELTSSGKPGFSVAASPSDTTIAVGAAGDINIIDTRNWNSVRLIDDIHADDVTRIRYCGSDQHLCTAGEDQMINIIDQAAQEDDLMQTVINCGESCNKMRYFSEVNMVGVTGTCENAYLVPAQPEANEVKFDRRDPGSYVVDFVPFNGSLCLLVGRHAEEDSTTVGPLELLDTQGGRSLGSIDKAHKDVVRVALSVHPTGHSVALNQNQQAQTAGGNGNDGAMGGTGPSSRLITAGEDGIIAWWSATATGVSNTSSFNNSSNNNVNESRKTRAAASKPRSKLSRPY